MKTIATLGPSVRLVVFQFLMKKNLVPAVVSPKLTSSAPPLSPVSGVKVLESTPGLDVFPLASKVDCHEDYKLVDVWKRVHENNWKMSFVRFVFCRKEYVNRDELYPEFVTKRDELEKVLVDMVSENLWATQGYLNPYLEKGGTDIGHKVLMFGCAGRKPNEMVFSDGRDENGRGIGSKVHLSTISQQLTLMTGDEVILADPEPVEDQPEIDFDTVYIE